MKIKSGLIVALAAGSIAGIAQADDVELKTLEPTGVANVKGYVYMNPTTGEQVISTDDVQNFAVRGDGWAWDNSAIDPCFPVSAGDPDTDAVTWVFTGLNDAADGDLIPAVPTAIQYWGEWMEAPFDSMINGFTFGYFSTVLDVDSDGDGVEDGVPGHEMVMAFTEQDIRSNRSGALANTALSIIELPGALDLDGSGDISFTEGNAWFVYIDLADAPIEIGDSDGSNSPADPAAVGLDITGNGLANCGFKFGFRQPGVAEGDGLIDRFPALDDPDFRNPDGLDIGTFPNIVDVGGWLVHPSMNAGIDGDPDCYAAADPADDDAWPYVAGCDDAAPFPLGITDAMGLVDAIGTDTGLWWFGGFTCSPTTPPPSPPFNQPFAGPRFQFNVNAIGGGGCDPADNSEPFGVHDLADIGGFVGGFPPNGTCDPVTTDIAAPFGVCDLADIGLFVQEFTDGCP